MDPTPKQKCEGINSKKEPCGMIAVEGSKYCNHHNPATPRCGAVRKGKDPCRMVVKKQGDRCRHH
jgi:hypothetical protein